MRFECSLEEYKKYKLGELVENVVAGATPKTSVDDYWNGGDIPWLSSGEVHKKFIYFTDKFITSEGYNNSSTKIVPTNSVLIALAGQGKTRGTVAINKIELCTNQSIASIIPNEMLNYKYLFYYLESKYEYLRALSSSDGGRGGLNLKLIRSIPIQVPSIKEQENISNFINEIDKKILLLEQKHKLYDDFKKYLMQQIFTQKLRFVDFNNSSWKDYKFKDLGTVKSGVGFSNKYQGHLDLDYNFYKVSDMNLKGNEKVMTRSNNTIDDNLLKDIGVKLIENPSIIFAKVGEAIFLNRKRIAKQPFLIDNNMMAFSPNENVDLEFMYYLATSINFGKYAQTGALPSYNASDIYSIKCKIPPIEEQKRIGKLLSLADNKIDFCSNQLNKTQEFKKGLLQQMFVVQLILSLLQNKKHI